MASNKNTLSVFKLKISNIPSYVEKEEIESIFSEYGDVTGFQLIKLNKGRNSAYLTYSSYREAESAIKALNNVLPLELNVEFVEKDIKNQQKLSNSDLSSSNSDYFPKKSSQSNAPSEKKFVDNKFGNSHTNFQKNILSHHDESFNTSLTDSTIFNSEESLSPYEDSNLMYTRGTLHINNKDGKRLVAYGTGHTYYSLPQPDFSIGSYIQNLIDKRERGIFKFSPEADNRSIAKEYQIKNNSKHKFDHQDVPTLTREEITESAAQKKEILGNVNQKHEKENVMDKVDRSLNKLSENVFKKFKISQSIPFPNILETLKVGNKGYIIFNTAIAEGECNVSIVPQGEIDNFGCLLQDMKGDCLKELEKEPNFIPKIGELVCGEYNEDDWFRGKLLSLNPVMKLAAVDDGRIFIPEKISPVPKKYDNMPSFGVACKLFENSVRIPKNKIGQLTGEYKVIEVSKDSALLHIEVETDQEQDKDSEKENKEEAPEFETVARITLWNPQIEQNGIIEDAPLFSEQEVIITDVTNHNLLYVRSQDKEELKRVHLLEQKIAKYSLNRKSLKKSPVVGQIVLAQYSQDDDFYRAEVTKIEGDKVLVHFIDYGNKEITTLEKLFDLSEKLKEPASCVTKITLKDLPDQEIMSLEVAEFLREFISNEVTLKCIFNGQPLKDGVILLTSNNESINTKIKLLLGSN